MSSPSAVVNTLLGKSIDGYQIEKLLGQSTISALYLARSSKQDQAVMFTTFTLPERFSPQARKRFNDRFLRLVSALARLRHQHIFPVSDFGLQADSLYMVTALTPASTLAAFLQRQPHLSTAQVIDMLRQIVDGIEYAHRSGVVHGSLNAGNILLDSEQHVQILGFGLVQGLALSEIEPFQHPYAHLLSVAMTFLGDPVSIAPEVVQGMPVTPSADIYALGTLLFVLLSGKPPFAEADPLKTALARLHTPVPSLGELRPDLPLSLDLVVQRALSRDPLQRYPSAGSLLKALEQAMREGDTAKLTVVTPQQSVVFPSMKNGLLDDRTWEGDEGTAANKERDSHQQAIQGIDQQNTASLSVVHALSIPPQDIVAESVNPPEEGAIDPFVWWSPAALSSSDKQSFTWVGNDAASSLPTTAMSAPSHSPMKKERRRLVAALVTGGVALSGLGAGSFVLAHWLQGSPGAQGNTKQGSSGVASQPTHLPRATEPAQSSPTAAPKPSPTATSRPDPTATPRPSPTPSHTGTVVGSTSQAANSAKAFVNPLDGSGSILVSLPSGAFVAFESTCPHEGARVYYNSSSHMLICPRHNALFDPARDAMVLQGPPRRSLPAVAIHVNGDGTITVG